MADDAVSKSGVYIDSKTGKVVEKAPEEGYMLVRPGGTIDATRRAAIDAANTAANPPQESASLDSMTKAELQAEADSRGVEIPSGATKAEILEALGG